MRWESYTSKLRSGGKSIVSWDSCLCSKSTADGRSLKSHNCHQSAFKTKLTQKAQINHVLTIWIYLSPFYSACWTNGFYQKLLFTRKMSFFHKLLFSSHENVGRKSNKIFKKRQNPHKTKQTHQKKAQTKQKPNT